MKTILAGCLLFICSNSLVAQGNDSLIKKSNTIPHSFAKVGALVSYYFWEEDSLGFIINNEIKKPFLQNYFIECSSSHKVKDTICYSNLTCIINSFAHDIKYKNDEIEEKKHFEIQNTQANEKVYFPLNREEAKAKGSVILINKNGNWNSKRRHSVLYFTISENNQLKYYYSNDSIILHKHNIKLPSNGQYMVLTYMKNDKKIDRQVVYNYLGEDVTDYFLQEKTMEPQRVIVFANGYRGPKSNQDESDNLVTTKDRYHYWYKIDNLFVERLNPDVSYYIDGSLSITTSNHNNMTNFAFSFLRSTFIMRTKNAKNNYNLLNSGANAEGFYIRKDKGKIAAQAFLNALCNSPACRETKDTVDIVSHSMGYAYSLGFIEELKGKVVFGKVYILAPENGCLDSVDWNMFEEVWQYGSNLGEKDADPVWEQDGVAPQCKVKGLENLPPCKGGRVCIPKDWPDKNFIDSHQLYNFYWIFERIKKGEAGYIGL